MSQASPAPVSLGGGFGLSRASPAPVSLGGGFSLSRVSRARFARGRFWPVTSVPRARLARGRSRPSRCRPVTSVPRARLARGRFPLVTSVHRASLARGRFPHAPSVRRASLARGRSRVCPAPVSLGGGFRLSRASTAPVLRTQPAPHRRPPSQPRTPGLHPQPASHARSAAQRNGNPFLSPSSQLVSLPGTLRENLKQNPSIRDAFGKKQCLLRSPKPTRKGPLNHTTQSSQRPRKMRGSGHTVALSPRTTLSLSKGSSWYHQNGTTDLSPHPPTTTRTKLRLPPNPPDTPTSQPPTARIPDPFPFQTARRHGDGEGAPTDGRAGQHQSSPHACGHRASMTQPPRRLFGGNRTRKPCAHVPSMEWAGGAGGGGEGHNYTHDLCKKVRLGVCFPFWGSYVHTLEESKGNHSSVIPFRVA